MHTIEENICYILVVAPFIVPLFLPCVDPVPPGETLVVIILFGLGTGAALNLFRLGPNRAVAWIAFLVYALLFGLMIGNAVVSLA